MSFLRLLTRSSCVKTGGDGVSLLPLQCLPDRLSVTMSALNDEISDRARADRLDLIRDALLLRIRPHCPAMPQDLFLELVESMAELQLRYEMDEHRR